MGLFGMAIKSTFGLAYGDKSHRIYEAGKARKGGGRGGERGEEGEEEEEIKGEEKSGRKRRRMRERV